MEMNSAIKTRILDSQLAEKALQSKGIHFKCTGRACQICLKNRREQRLGDKKKRQIEKDRQHAGGFLDCSEKKFLLNQILKKDINPFAKKNVHKTQMKENYLVAEEESLLPLRNLKDFDQKHINYKKKHPQIKRGLVLPAINPQWKTEETEHEGSPGYTDQLKLPSVEKSLGPGQKQWFISSYDKSKYWKSNHPPLYAGQLFQKQPNNDINDQQVNCGAWVEADDSEDQLEIVEYVKQRKFGSGGVHAYSSVPMLDKRKHLVNASQKNIDNLSHESTFHQKNETSLPIRKTSNTSEYQDFQSQGGYNRSLDNLYFSLPPVARRKINQMNASELEVLERGRLSLLQQCRRDLNQRSLHDPRWSQLQNVLIPRTDK